MKLALFGASGGLGLHLLEAALADGHEVAALVRSPQKVQAFAGRIAVQIGDYFDPQARAAVLRGAEAVLSTIGPPQKRVANDGEYARAMEGLIGQMQEAGIRRIIAVGGAGLRLGDEHLALSRALMRQMLRLMIGKGYLDKEAEHNRLFASALDWTIARPTQITSAKGQLVVTHDRPASAKVDSRQVAQFMVGCLTDATFVRAAPFLATKA